LNRTKREEDFISDFLIWRSILEVTFTQSTSLDCS
jgi:hypothetical protein